MLVLIIPINSTLLTFLFVHVVIIVVTLDHEGKIIMVHESDPLPLVFKIGRSSHPVMLTKSQL